MVRTDILAGSPIFLAGLVHTLTSARIRIVATRTSPDDAPSWQADVALVDVDALPAHELLPRIEETAKTAAVLVLNAATPEDGEACLRAGASGVVDKRTSCESVVEAVRTVAAGACFWPEDWTSRPPAGRAEAPEYQLSEREEQVLSQIARGLTHGQIATRLGISPHTVDTYVKRIRSKLGVGNKAELTRAALLGGLTRRPIAVAAPGDALDPCAPLPVQRGAKPGNCA